MIAAILKWLAGARWRASVLHLLEMWVVALPTWATTQSRPAAASAVIAWYWSRKMTEMRALASPGDLLKAWNVGWFPWLWPWPMQLDFYVPALAALILGLV